MDNHENRKIRAKDRQWKSDVDVFIHKTGNKIETFINKMNKNIKHNTTSWLDSYFHDKDLKGMDKFIHRFWVIFINGLIFWILTK